MAGKAKALPFLSAVFCPALAGPPVLERTFTKIFGRGGRGFAARQRADDFGRPGRG